MKVKKCKSLRAALAAHALQGILAGADRFQHTDSDSVPLLTYEVAASEAVAYADALLKALEANQ